MLKKVLYGFSLLLELLLLGGTYIVYYFSVKRMGMARHVIFLNQTWEKKYPVPTLILGAMLLVGGLALVNLIIYLKKRPFGRKLPGVELATSLVIAGGFVGFGLGFNTTEVRAYYMILILLFLAALVQQIRTMTVLSGRRNP